MIGFDWVHKFLTMAISAGEFVEQSKLALTPKLATLICKVVWP
jgi:hypothetical protein